MKKAKIKAQMNENKNNKTDKKAAGPAAPKPAGTSPTAPAATNTNIATIPEDLNDTTSKRMTRSRSKSSVESPKQESKKQKTSLISTSSRTNLAQENQVLSSRKSTRTSTKQLDKCLGDNPFTKVNLKLIIFLIFSDD